MTLAELVVAVKAAERDVLGAGLEPGDVVVRLSAPGTAWHRGNVDGCRWNHAGGDPAVEVVVGPPPGGVG